MPSLFSSSDTSSSALNENDQPRTRLWLLIWFVIALIIRFTYLSTKPPWMDEVATTLYSLGNYSRLIPLNEVIDLDGVLRPLQITPGTTASDVIRHLLTEDNHPPGYFVVAHWWMRLFHWLRGSTDGYASLWAERAITAFLGALAVPFMHRLAQLCFRRRHISMISAALIAVSPFAVYLSQEARPYSLAILLDMVSLCCFVIATRTLIAQKSFSQKSFSQESFRWRTVWLWIVVNAVGVSVHYFFALSTLAQGLTLLVLLLQQYRWDKGAWRGANWIKVYVTALGTLAGTVAWLPILLNFYGSPQSSFLKPDTIGWTYFVNPIVQSLAGWFYAILSPVTNGLGWPSVTVIVVTCVVLLAVYAPWLTVIMVRSLKFQLNDSNRRAGIQAMFGFFVAANALFFAVSYGLGFDITRGHRYGFVFFPSILILVGCAIAPFWQTPTFPTSSPFKNFSRVKLPLLHQTISGKALVITVLCVAFLGSQVITFGRSNLKFYKVDHFIEHVQAASNSPVVIGTSTLITEYPVVIGMEIMSVGWEIQRSFNPAAPDQNWKAPPRFLLVENNVTTNNDPEILLEQQIQGISEDIDLWMLGGSGETLRQKGSQADLSTVGCQVAPDGKGSRGSFSYTHYICDGRA